MPQAGPSRSGDFNVGSLHERSSGSFVGSYRRRLYDFGASPSETNLAHEVQEMRAQTADLSTRALAEGLEDEIESDQFYDSPDPKSDRPDWPEPMPRRYSETTPLMAATPDDQLSEQIGNHKSDTGKFQITSMLSYLPSVALGTLLNVLDGLSYGMILFPLGTAAFAGLESAGLSIFYVSTIVSQLVFSLGGSKFESCVGSEMIEVVPFFHSMANTIAASLQGAPQNDILATTITAYALSSIVTGLVFFLLGYLNLGTLVGFFPQHILLGCIGGVGWFLIATGIEVAARLPSTLQYDLPTLEKLLEPDSALKWGTCLAVGAFLMFMERKCHHGLIVPGILIGLFFAVHIIIFFLPISLDDARNAGWLFEAQRSDEPWYFFYSLYRMGTVHWSEVIRGIPAMLALTFFGIIHVPINIPALASATKNDTIDVNRELIAHGVSNTLSGMLGSIQNYLVYTNSVLFVKSGADTRIAGVMLAGATALVMLAGPVIIGYIPVVVVASLIFMMGMDLMAEGLVDTFGKVGKKEYLTICIIVIIMGGYDFVVGILAGIVLACMFFVITSARNSPVSSTFSGSNVRAAIRRHPVLSRFLRRMSTQIYIIKLQGALFFGTNVAVEQSIRRALENARNIKFLIIDLDKITSIDYSSADTFARIKRICDAKQVRMVLSGASTGNEKVRGLRAVDLIQDSHDKSETKVHVFPSINLALECCENQFLARYYQHRDSIVANRHSSLRNIPHSMLDTPKLSYPFSDTYGAYGTTPRTKHLRFEAEQSATEDLHIVSRWHKFQQPMPMLMQIVEGQSDKGADFWYRLLPYLEKEVIPAGTVVVDHNQQLKSFYMVESGYLRLETDDNVLQETILAGTTFGEIPFFSEASSFAKIITESDCVLWKLTKESFHKMSTTRETMDLAIELMRVGYCFALDRVRSMNSYLRVIAM
ncbi:Uncharacterized protein C24H6.11c [Wickerhamiella sorbophila]|uniref:Uncharacterized protein C24H6.11c n=1 Tax=Wickerhamiella sorbophila TaxID=45607 RepID=A0A2T0FII8_9ASCO|nr:Uncharacterized protein C24H6.11c [Wickerhamiella sorbophila]PRT54800.1 Uncharacterized protein C24H6.11c [Wickerhamiella sorbophila]